MRQPATPCWHSRTHPTAIPRRWRHADEVALRNALARRPVAADGVARGVYIASRHRRDPVNAVAPALNLAPLLDVQGVNKSFRKPDGDDLVVLENVNLALRPGEIVGLL